MMVLSLISNQETLNLSPFMAIYDMVVPENNMLRQITFQNTDEYKKMLESAIKLRQKIVN